MAGFKREALVHLDFTGIPELDGFECAMDMVSLETFIEIEVMLAEFKKPGRKTAQDIRGHYDVFGDLLYSWNLIDKNDEPIPADAENFRKRDPRMVGFIISGYMAALSAVPKALKAASAAGGPSAEESTLGLEMSSPSPPS
jgi:hypothetical protein